jgi:DNA-binding beta-propeller fold protein YncE
MLRTVRAAGIASLLSAACSSSSPAGTGASPARTQPDSGATPAADGAAPATPRLVVTADWLGGSLSVLSYDKLIAGAATRDEALIGTVDLAQYPPGPLEVAIAPDGKTAVVTVGPGFFPGLVGNLIGATTIPAGGTLLLVDLQRRAVVAELPPPTPPMGVAITPDGKRAFSADHTGGTTLTVVDLTTRKIVTSLEVGGSPEETTVSPDGKIAVVNTDKNGAIRLFDPSDPAGTLSAPLVVGDDPDRAAFVPREKKLLIAKSGPNPGYSVIDVSSPSAPTILESQPLTTGVPYGADTIPGTTRVLVSIGISACELHEVDLGVSPSKDIRTISLPCAKLSLPLSTAIDREGTHAFVGMPGDNSLMVVDLGAGTARRIPWLTQTGPTCVAISR